MSSTSVLTNTVAAAFIKSQIIIIGSTKFFFSCISFSANFLTRLDIGAAAINRALIRTA